MGLKGVHNWKKLGTTGIEKCGRGLTEVLSHNFLRGTEENHEERPEYKPTALPVTVAQSVKFHSVLFQKTVSLIVEIPVGSQTFCDVTVHVMAT
jgi:hypothetical protein